jgi:hypothetical protein
MIGRHTEEMQLVPGTQHDLSKDATSEQAAPGVARQRLQTCSTAVDMTSKPCPAKSAFPLLSTVGTR